MSEISTFNPEVDPTPENPKKELENIEKPVHSPMLEKMIAEHKKPEIDPTSKVGKEIAEKVEKKEIEKLPLDERMKKDGFVNCGELGGPKIYVEFKVKDAAPKVEKDDLKIFGRLFDAQNVPDDEINFELDHDVDGQYSAIRNILLMKGEQLQNVSKHQMFIEAGKNPLRTNQFGFGRITSTEIEHLLENHGVACEIKENLSAEDLAESIENNKLNMIKVNKAQLDGEKRLFNIGVNHWINVTGTCRDKAGILKGFVYYDSVKPDTALYMDVEDYETACKKHLFDVEIISKDKFTPSGEIAFTGFGCREIELSNAKTEADKEAIKEKYRLEDEVAEAKRKADQAALEARIRAEHGGSLY